MGVDGGELDAIFEIIEHIDEARPGPGGHRASDRAKLKQHGPLCPVLAEMESASGDRRQVEIRRDASRLRAAAKMYVFFIQDMVDVDGQLDGLSRSKPPGLSGERSLAHRGGVHPMVQRNVFNSRRKRTLNQIIWIVGAVVIVVFILGFLGLI